jgi:hypothetical protein
MPTVWGFCEGVQVGWKSWLAAAFFMFYGCASHVLRLCFSSSAAALFTACGCISQWQRRGKQKAGAAHVSVPPLFNSIIYMLNVIVTPMLLQTF